MTSEQVLNAAVFALVLGAQRDLAHANHASSRRLSEDYEALGIFGECKFAADFGLRVDRKLRTGGDQGIDFTVGEYTIDVKTARIPNHLLVEVAKIENAADIFVLCGFGGFLVEPRLWGWEYRAAVAEAPAKTFGKHNILNHYIPAQQLRPMATLRELLGKKTQ